MEDYELHRDSNLPPNAMLDSSFPLKTDAPEELDDSENYGMRTKN